MAGFITHEGAQLALNLLLRNTGTQPATVYLGLATNSADSLDKTAVLADLTEVDDAGYARQEVVFGEPSLVEGKVTVENNAQLEFGPWSEDEDVGVQYVFLTDASSGTTGTLIGLLELPSSKAPSSGESLISTESKCDFNIV